MINSSSHGVTLEIKSIIDCFKQIEPQLEQTHAHFVSNDVLALVHPHLDQLGFAVETGKGKDEKIDVPVLFSENNEVDKSFFADALSADSKIVIEFEASRAVNNNQFKRCFSGVYYVRGGIFGYCCNERIQIQRRRQKSRL